MTGNCLKGSRPLLSFDPTFEKEPHYALLKELFIQTFSTPQYHPKSQPFVDHILTFTIADNRIWFRNYQIIEEDGSLVEIGPRFVLNLIKIFQGSFGGATLYENPRYQSPNMIIEEDGSLVEIGPRFVLNLIKIFQGSFGGATLYENPRYQSPNMHRRMIRLATAARLKEKQQVKELQKMKKSEPKVKEKEDPTQDVFVTPAEEKPSDIQLVAPEPKPVKKKKNKEFKRQRKLKQKRF
ncbi:UNVERIFIED_CONTAM: hypothetical protein FKN15_055506 [Acipenser sinensis]